MLKLKLALGLLCCLGAGCSGATLSKKTAQSAQVAIDQAIVSEAAGKHADALPLVDQAITMGGLSPDHLAEALLLRARCYCATGNLSGAEQDVAAAEQGSPNPAIWHFTRAILFDKQGKAAESKTELSKAKKIDPSLKL